MDGEEEEARGFGMAKGGLSLQEGHQADDYKTESKGRRVI